MSAGVGGVRRAQRGSDGVFEYVLRPAGAAAVREPAGGSPGGEPSGGEHRSTAPEGALLLLHGRGTDELDLLPLLDGLDPDARLTGVTLRAPLELTPGGYFWYVVREIGRPDEPTFRRTYEGVSEWIDHLPAITGVPLERTVIGGFSQGAVMAYAFALGRGRPSPAGLLALSGFIPEVPGFFELDLAGHRDVPVAIAHGARDGVIPVQFGRSAAERLEAVGLDVLYRETALMAHGIDDESVRELERWLKERTTTARRHAA
jgi:phospholipase/carboxylesterase